MKPAALPNKPMLVLGLMSGTSADGIDVALVRVARGQPSRTGLHARLLDFHTFPYPSAVRAEVLRIAGGGQCSPATLSNLNFLLGELFARAALAACARFRVRPGQISLIGSHGQTIYHQGKAQRFIGSWSVSSTLQIGEPAVIAEETGITTVGDFRTADMAAGGQGAPLVPFVDYLLFNHPQRSRIALNIGGIANLSAIPAAARPNQVVAFDTGPGNMLIDALVQHFSGGRRTFDRNAEMARRGMLQSKLLTELLADPYFKAPPPKTCGREQFGESVARRVIAWGADNNARPEDLVRIATFFTALSILSALNRWGFAALTPATAKGPRLSRSRSQMRLWKESLAGRPMNCDLVLSGGGAHNPLIRAQLEAGVAGYGVRVCTSGDLGVPEDGKEAFAFAILAYETLHRRPSNLPSATGARHPAILGKICYASR